MTKSLWHKIDSTEIYSSELQFVKKDEVLVYSKYSMISLGTETSVLNRKVPPKMWDYMRAPYMQGSFDLPIKYGYALSGILENGKKVHVMHPHQDLCVVEKSSVFSDCQNLPLKKIPLISNMETIINAIWDSHVDKEKDILVCGFGNIGALLATTLKFHFGFDVKILEKCDFRKQKATELGFDLYEKNSGFDIAFNTTTNQSALQFCIDNANEEGQIIELSWFGTNLTTLDLGGNFHKNRIQIKASQVSKIPIQKRETFDYVKRKQLAAKILENQMFDKLITDVISLEEAPDFFNEIRHKKETHKGLIYLIKY